MELMTVSRSFLELRCLTICTLIFVCLQSSVSYSDSCKVERSGQDTVFSESCTKRQDGKYLVKLCTVGHCLADSIGTAPQYKCPQKSPGSPAFCLPFSLVSKFELPINSIQYSASREHISASFKGTENMRFEVKNDQEFRQLRDAINKNVKIIGSRYVLIDQKTSPMVVCNFDKEKMENLLKKDAPISNCDPARTTGLPSDQASDAERAEK